MSELDLIIKFGRFEGHSLTLRMSGSRQSKELWDSELLECEVQANAGAFKGDTTVAIDARVLANLIKGLKELYNELSGEVTFSSVGRELWVSIVGNDRGQFTARCTLNDAQCEHTRLRFDVSFSRSDIPEIVRDHSLTMECRI